MQRNDAHAQAYHKTSLAHENHVLKEALLIPLCKRDGSPNLL